MVLGIIRIAVFTRLLEQSIFGQFTLLMLIAGFVTMFVRSVIVTGTLMSAFRGGDDDEGVEDDSGGTAPPASSNQQALLGTGLMTSIALTVALTGVTAANASGFSDLLLGDQVGLALTTAVLLGSLHGVFRLASHIPRFERKPKTYTGLQLLQSAVGIGLGIALIDAGMGLEGAVGGLTLGSLLATAVAIGVSRHRFSFHIYPKLIAQLARTGAPFAAITIGFFLFRSVDTFMVSRYLPDTDIALYRVGARVGGLSSSLVSGVLLAWGPLMRGPMRGALHREGALEKAGARLLTYYWLFGIWVVVALTLLRQFLVKVAPPDYVDAAVLIPVLGISTLGLTALVMVYRTSRMTGKRRLLGIFATVMPIALALASVVMIPPLGLAGAAAAATVVPLVGAGIFLWLSQRSDRAIDLPIARMTRATALGAVVCGALAPLVGDSPVQLGLSALTVVAFPVLFVAVGAIDRVEARNVVDIARRSLPRFGQKEEPLLLLPSEDLDLLEALLRNGRRPADMAEGAEASEGDVTRRLVLILRETGDIGEERSVDERIGRYLLSRENVNLRDREGAVLALQKDVDPVEVDQLNREAERIAAIGARRWREIRTGLPEEPA